jgi:hypothetical protein
VNEIWNLPFAWFIEVFAVTARNLTVGAFFCCFNVSFYLVMVSLQIFSTHQELLSPNRKLENLKLLIKIPIGGILIAENSVWEKLGELDYFGNMFYSSSSRLFTLMDTMFWFGFKTLTFFSS